MVVIKTKRGPFSVIEMYYPQATEVQEITSDLALNEVVYLRQMPESISHSHFTASYTGFETSLLDLTRTENGLMAGMNRTCRRQLRNADRLRDHIEVRQNDFAAYRDFLALHNSFVSLNRHSEPLSTRRLEAFKSVSDVFIAYFDGRPACGHLILRDNEQKRVGVLFAAIRREHSSTLISSLNRWLHWYEMRSYKSQGMQVYDFCGVGTDTPETARIAYFKQSFGGVRTLEHNYIVTRGPGRVAVRLFYRMRQIRFRYARLRRMIRNRRLSNLQHL